MFFAAGRFLGVMGASMSKSSFGPPPQEREENEDRDETSPPTAKELKTKLVKKTVRYHLTKLEFRET